MRGALARVALVCATLAGAPGAQAEPFTPGSLLVVHDAQLLEYTRDGALLQTLPVALPEPVPNPWVRDVVVDRFGRAHVRDDSGATTPGQTPRVNTYDPYADAWSHVEAHGAGRGLLSLRGDTLYARLLALSLVDGGAMLLNVPDRNVASVIAGLDGLLYVLNSLSRSTEVRVVDPAGSALVRTLELGSASPFLDASGIAVAPNGTLYVASVDGRIYRFDREGRFLGAHATPVIGLLDLELAPDGLLVATSGLGHVVVTDLGLGAMRSFHVGGSNGPAYVGLVPTQIEHPDVDGDLILDFQDVCPQVPDDQTDRDDDGRGDACDPYPLDPGDLALCFEEGAAAEAATGGMIAENARLRDEIGRVEAANTALRAEIEALAAALDSDGDGVPDADDRCPDTRGVHRADAEGCSVPQRHAGGASGLHSLKVKRTGR
jgi:hypothetical protein